MRKQYYQLNKCRMLVRDSVSDKFGFSGTQRTCGIAEIIDIENCCAVAVNGNLCFR